MRVTTKLFGIVSAILAGAALNSTGATEGAGSKQRIAYLAAEASGFWQVWVMDSGGEDARQVTRSDYEKSHISWFPDGVNLLVSGLDGRIVKLNVDDGSEVMIDVPLGGATDAVVSPDGRKIALTVSTAEARDDGDIWTVSVDGKDLRKHTNMAWLQHQPVWSSDGRFIYFLSGDGGDQHDVCRLTLETGAVEQITSGSLYHFDIAVSADGRLAFSSNQSGNYEIWLRELDGLETRLTEDPALDGGPSWSPRGDAILFHSWRTGRSQLYAMDLGATKETEPRRLTANPGGARSPVWSFVEERGR